MTKRLFIKTSNFDLTGYWLLEELPSNEPQLFLMGYIPADAPDIPNIR